MQIYVLNEANTLYVKTLLGVNERAPNKISKIIVFK